MAKLSTSQNTSDAADDPQLLAFHPKFHGRTLLSKSSPWAGASIFPSTNKTLKIKYIKIFRVKSNLWSSADVALLFLAKVQRQVNCARVSDSQKNRVQRYHGAPDYSRTILLKQNIGQGIEPLCASTEWYVQNIFICLSQRYI
jgi:hypothetical protein